MTSDAPKPSSVGLVKNSKPYIGYGTTRGALEEEFIKLMSRRKSFYVFVRDLVLSKPGYVDGEHIKLLCDTAQQVYEGHIKRAIITVPPRHMKSTIFSEAFPAWVLGNDPQKEFIISSYSDSQSGKMMSASRQLMEEPEYKRTFSGQDWVIDNVHDAMLRGKANGRPNMISRGTGAGITGSGADILILDDLFKSSAEASSIVIRDKTYDWYMDTALTRLSPNGAIIIVNTRWHHDDLIGRLERDEKENWHILHLPAIGTVDGHEVALWEERYTLAHLHALRKSMGSHRFSAVYQGRPTPAEGGMFKRAWFQFTDDPLPKSARRVRYYDMASTEGDGDFTVGVLMAYDESTKEIVIEDVDRAQRSVAQNETHLLNTANLDGYNTYIRMEEEGGSSGKTATRSYQDVLRGFPFGGVRVTGSKETRADAVAGAIEHGRVKLLRARWNMDFIDEMCEFPLGANDDQVDACSGAYNFLMRYDTDTPSGFGNFGFI